MKARLFQLGRFGATGIAATVLHASTATGLSRWLDISPHLSNFLGFLAGFGLACLGHLFWTYPDQYSPLQSALRYFAIAALGFIISTLTLSLCLAHPNIPLWIAQIVAVGIIPPFSYLASTFWAFAHPKNS